MNLPAEIASHRNRIVELKANILDAEREIEREQVLLAALEAVSAELLPPPPEPAAPAAAARRAAAREG